MTFVTMHLAVRNNLMPSRGLDRHAKDENQGPPQSEGHEPHDGHQASGWQRTVHGLLFDLRACFDYISFSFEPHTRSSHIKVDFG